MSGRERCDELSPDGYMCGLHLGHDGKHTTLIDSSFLDSMLPTTTDPSLPAPAEPQRCKKCGGDTLLGGGVFCVKCDTLQPADAGVRALTFQEWGAKVGPHGYLSADAGSAQRYGDYCREQGKREAVRVIGPLVRQLREETVQLTDKWILVYRKLDAALADLDKGEC